MIVETSDNRFYRVAPIADVNLAHVWTGFAVKKVRGQLILKANAKPVLVRKIGSRKVEG